MEYAITENVGLPDLFGSPSSCVQEDALLESNIDTFPVRANLGTPLFIYI